MHARPARTRSVRPWAACSLPTASPAWSTRPPSVPMALRIRIHPRPHIHPRIPIHISTDGPVRGLPAVDTPSAPVAVPAVVGTMAGAAARGAARAAGPPAAAASPAAVALLPAEALMDLVSALVLLVATHGLGGTQSAGPRSPIRLLLRRRIRPRPSLHAYMHRHLHPATTPAGLSHVIPRASPSHHATQSRRCSHSCSPVLILCPPHHLSRPRRPVPPRPQPGRTQRTRRSHPLRRPSRMSVACV